MVPPPPPLKGRVELIRTKIRQLVWKLSGLFMKSLERYVSSASLNLPKTFRVGENLFDLQTIRYKKKIDF